LDKLIADKKLTNNEIGVLHDFCGRWFVITGEYSKALESYFKCLEI